MAFPSIGEITALVKDMVSGPSEEATPEVEATAETQETPTEETAAVVPATGQESPTTPQTSATEVDPVKAISEKGAKAFIADLPPELIDQLGSELNKKWYARLNERDTKAARLEAQVASLPNLIAAAIDDRFDAIRLEAMPEDERKSFLERKELARLKAKEEQDKKPRNPLEDPQVVSHIESGWRVLEEAGLPKDPNDPRVKEAWAAGWNATDPATGLAAMSAAAKRVTAPAPKPEPTFTKSQLAELVEAEVQKRLKGTLKADTGKPGGSVTSSRPKNYDEARAGALELLRAEQR